MKMPGNMQNMMAQAQKMQQKMQEEIALIRIEASAGGGMVKIQMDGHKNVLGVKIDPAGSEPQKHMTEAEFKRLIEMTGGRIDGLGPLHG